MSLSLILAALWVLAATGTALLPMRYQLVPGLILLLAAPILLGFIALQHGVWIMLFGLAAFVSMFRYPLKYIALKALGRDVPSPREFRERRQ